MTHTFGIFSLNNERASLPKYATVYSSCFDLTFCVPSNQNTVETYDARNNKSPTHVIGDTLTLYPGVRALVPTAMIFDLGASMDPTYWSAKAINRVHDPKNNFSMKVYSRSGLSFKTGLGLINSVGIIDADYTGQLMIPMINHSDKEVTLTIGDRIAQAEILNNGVSIRSKFTWISSPPTEFGGRTGGFGSTGGFTTTPVA